NQKGEKLQICHNLISSEGQEVAAPRNTERDPEELKGSQESGGDNDRRKTSGCQETLRDPKRTERRSQSAGLISKETRSIGRCQKTKLHLRRRLHKGGPSPRSHRSQHKVNLATEKLLHLKKNVRQMRKTMKRKSPNKVKVGIFSRSAESEYEWLKTRLTSESFVKSVRPCCITNNGSSEFSSSVSRCDFGILYHTQNRGRVNLTDVTDSLYDEELQYLSSRLEKKNVIVVIDDLTDSSEERKKEILKNQPKLGTLAADVFLFSGYEKKVTEEK
ncbi:unnamed protein product, partial [Ranitomeya imitator]